MSGQTNTREQHGSNKVRVSLYQLPGQPSLYVLRDQDMSNKFNKPCAMRLVDMSEFSETEPLSSRLVFLELRREGGGAVGPYGKNGLAQYVSQKLPYSSVMSQFGGSGREPGLDAVLPSADRGHDCVTPGDKPPLPGTIIHIELLRFLSRQSIRSNNSCHTGVFCFWIDKLCILQGDHPKALQDRRWHDIQFQKDIHGWAAQRFALPCGLSKTYRLPSSVSSTLR